MLRTVIKVALMIAGLRLLDFLYYHIRLMRFRHGKAESEDTDT